jgi:peptide/nickel transport system permease protein
VLGLQFSVLLAGAIIIENVFALPGSGPPRLPGDRPARPDRGQGPRHAASRRSSILINFAVELLYGLIDPRLRQAS